MTKNILPIGYTIAIVGDSKVGKSTFLESAITGNFLAQYSATIGIDHRMLTYTQQDLTIKLIFREVCGNPAFTSRLPSYLKNLSACILLCDLNNKASYDHLENWLEKLPPNIPITLIGTNYSDNNQVSESELRNFATKYDGRIQEVLVVNLQHSERKALTRDIIQKTIKHCAPPALLFQARIAEADKRKIIDAKREAIDIINGYIKQRKNDRFGATTGPYSRKNKTEAALVVEQLIQSIDPDAPQKPPVERLKTLAPAIVQRGFLGLGRKRLGNAYERVSKLLGDLLPSITELENAAQTKI